MISPHYETIEGWFDWEDTYRRWAKDVPRLGRIVEVGNYKGRSLVFLLAALQAEGRTDVSIYAIDNGAGVGDVSGAALEQELRRNVDMMRYPGIDIIRADSLVAVEQFLHGTIDCVWIDGAHDEASVYADLDAWWPRVRRGGEMAGHDFTSEYGVNRAVTRWAQDNGQPLYVRPSCHTGNEPVQTSSWLFAKV